MSQGGRSEGIGAREAEETVEERAGRRRRGRAVAEVRRESSKGNIQPNS
jgi:hypothetical protein